MKKITLRILSHKRILAVRPGDNLADQIAAAGIPLSAYCLKRGLCGKCFVEVARGELPPVTEKETLLIRQKRLPDRYRLACLFKVRGDLAIRIPQSSLLQETSVLTTGLWMSVPIDPAVKKYSLEVKAPKISAPSSWIDLLEGALKKKGLRFPLGLLKRLPSLHKEGRGHMTAVLWNDADVLALEPGDTTPRNYGIAVDIGTTTVVVELVDLGTGKTVDLATALNGQAEFGSDVVSRISSAFLNEAGSEQLRQRIVTQLNEMLNGLADQNHISRQHIYEIVVAGNTAMNHFLLGLPVQSLAVSPFNAVFSRLPGLRASEAGFEIGENARLFIVPNIKSFIGGDISAGLLASGIAGRPGNYLFIDLGTNGEIVLKKGKKFLATSTAAGPAFEGMNISSGMLALPGAIYKAELKKKINVFTIQKKPPAGICGTGLIDLVALFKKSGVITAQGKITGEQKTIPVAGDILLTQKDVREVQLAVAAIKAGVRMMLYECHLSPQELDGIFIAGAFGNYLNVRNAMSIGLLPEIVPGKVIFIGNSSLAGAKQLLLSAPGRRTLERLIKTVAHVSLASDPSFQKIFIESLEFPKEGF